MLDGQVSLLTIAAAHYFALGEVPPRLGTEHPGRVPTASFRCKDGRFLHITCSDQHWRPLCNALGLDGLGADEGLTRNAGRLARRAEVMQALTRILAAPTRAEAVARLDATDVPNGPVLALDEVMADPQVRARGMVAIFKHPLLSDFPAPPVPFKFDGWDQPEVDRPHCSASTPR